MKPKQKFNRNQKSTNQKKQNGLILLELVVSLGIFLSVMTIGMGALLTMYGVNKKSQTLKTVMNNLSFAVESMAREIVVGTNYHCGASGGFEPKDCAGNDGDTYITFCSSDDEQIFYKFNEYDNTIERYVNTKDDPEDITCGSGNPGNDWQSITAPAPEVSIEKMNFYVDGNSVDIKQPIVTLILEGVASPGTEEESDFNLQVTLSQRAPKIPTN